MDYDILPHQADNNRFRRRLDSGQDSDTSRTPAQDPPTYVLIDKPMAGAFPAGERWLTNRRNQKSPRFPTPQRLDSEGHQELH